MRKIIKSFDRWLSKRLRVFESFQEPNCIIRLQYSQAQQDFSLDDELIHKGDLILELHLWNDHVPQIPASGQDLMWAV
jgi:hypothetical protein